MKVVRGGANIAEDGRRLVAWRPWYRCLLLDHRPLSLRYVYCRACHLLHLAQSADMVRVRVRYQNTLDILRLIP